MLACATHHTFVFKKIHSELIVYTSLIEPPYGMYVYFCVPKAGQVYIVYSTMDSTNSVWGGCRPGYIMEKPNYMQAGGSLIRLQS